MSNDTHADTILEALEDASIPLADAHAALDALVSDRDRERERADRAEAALRQIVPDVRLMLDDHFSGCVEEREPGMRAAGRLITLLEGTDEQPLPVGGINIPGPTTAERHAANRIALSAGSGGRETT